MRDDEGKLFFLNIPPFAPAQYCSVVWHGHGAEIIVIAASINWNMQIGLTRLYVYICLVNGIPRNPRESNERR